MQNHRLVFNYMNPTDLSKCLNTEFEFLLIDSLSALLGELIVLSIVLIKAPGVLCKTDRCYFNPAGIGVAPSSNSSMIVFNLSGFLKVNSYLTSRSLET